jgi:hypothetical protein
VIIVDAGEKVAAKVQLRDIDGLVFQPGDDSDTRPSAQYEEVQLKPLTAGL